MHKHILMPTNRSTLAQQVWNVDWRPKLLDRDGFSWPARSWRQAGAWKPAAPIPGRRLATSGPAPCRAGGAAGIYGMGGHVQLTTIGPNGAKTKTLRRWPDKIGEAVDPAKSPNLSH